MKEAHFQLLIESLKQAAAHMRGEHVPGIRVHHPRELDVLAIRHASGLTQKAFAWRVGVSVGTLRNWEQGRRRPEGPARILLALLERNPCIVEETLGRRAA